MAQYTCSSICVSPAACSFPLFCIPISAVMTFPFHSRSFFPMFFSFYLSFLFSALWTFLLLFPPFCSLVFFIPFSFLFSVLVWACSLWVGGFSESNVMMFTELLCGCMYVLGNYCTCLYFLRTFLLLRIIMLSYDDRPASRILL